MVNRLTRKKLFATWSHATSHLSRWLLHEPRRVIKLQPIPIFKVCHISYLRVLFHGSNLLLTFLYINHKKDQRKRMHSYYKIFILNFRTVQTVWYFRTVQTVWYFRTVQTVWYFRTVQTVWYFRTVQTVCWYFRTVQTVWYFRTVQTVWYFRTVQTVWYFRTVQTVWYFRTVQTVWYFRTVQTVWYLLLELSYSD